MMEAADLTRDDAPDEKHAAIVEAARRVFLAKGFAGASMDEIASEAAVSKRTVYNRFQSKDALFEAVIITFCGRFLAILDVGFTGERSIREELTATACDFLREATKPESIALRRITAFESVRFPELGRAYLDNGMFRLIGALEPHMRALADAGVLVIDDVPRAIMHLGALITEPLETKLSMGAEPDDLEEAIDIQVRTGVDVFLKAYGGPNLVD
ncbi:MAG: TetR/AcrR family transcriptional regulator [Pseudomonadota bacterium]